MKEEKSIHQNFVEILWKEHRPMAFTLITAIALITTIFALVIIHFQLGNNIPLLSISNPESAQYWGQIGDFIGGILNPTLSFIAFLTLLYTLKIQSDELKEARAESKSAREEALAANKIQEHQTKIFERQGFESAFFGLLNAHLKIIENVKYLDEEDSTTYHGRGALAKIAEKHIPFRELARGDFPTRETTAFRARCRALLQKNQLETGHYFRSLYQILKYIDSYGSSSIAPGKNKTLRELKEDLIRKRNSYLAQRQYANMLRAQFSSAEIDLIFANCLTPQGKDLKHYIEKYSFLKTFNRKRLRKYPRIIDLYSEIAYKDSEEITHQELYSIITTKPNYKEPHHQEHYDKDEQDH